MKITFKNQAAKPCTIPTEQKVFRGGSPTGWLVIFSITGGISSSELDELTVSENISSLDFSDDNGNTLFTLTGYTKLSSAVIRHKENATETVAEIQLTKGV